MPTWKQDRIPSSSLTSSFSGRTRIGARCTIGSGCVLLDADVADDVEIKPHSLVLNSRLAEGAAVGPFAHVRDGSDLRPGARIGNFVEVKKSAIGEGAKAMHLTYIGDATVGASNEHRRRHHHLQLRRRAKKSHRHRRPRFCRQRTELVAPVRIGDGAYIAAGSTITEDVPADSLAIARGRQVNKIGWVAARRKAVRKSPELPAKSTKSVKPEKQTRRPSRSKRASARPRKGSRKN